MASSYLLYHFPAFQKQRGLVEGGTLDEESYGPEQHALIMCQATNSNSNTVQGNLGLGALATRCSSGTPMI